MCFVDRLSTESPRAGKHTADPLSKPNSPLQAIDFKDFWVLIKKQASHPEIHSLGASDRPEGACPPSYPQFLWIRDLPL